MNLTTKPAFMTFLLVASAALGGCLSEGEPPAIDGTDPGNGGATNNVPSISGNPASAVTVGETYEFIPQASDADGDTLTFSVQNKPGWAQFDANDGSLSGMPLLGDVGSYQNIVISVSDGTDTTSLPGFAIEVTQMAMASTTLSWTAPTRNMDGSMLTDLRGFIIYYGTSSGNYTNQIRIDNPSVSSYLVDNLSPGTYFFSATAFNAAGVESRFAVEAVITLN